MTITIEPMAERHIESFYWAFDAVARERRFLALLEAPPLDQVRRFALDSLAKGSNVHLVAMDGENLIGWCDITRMERAVFAHCGILGMGLLPAYRGQGIGRRILSQTLEAAWVQAFARVELTVYTTNVSAFRLYLSAGFVKEGCLRRRALIDGDYIDSWMMAVVRDDAIAL